MGEGVKVLATKRVNIDLGDFVLIIDNEMGS